MKPSLATSVRGMLLRDLAAIARTIELYPDDESLWRQPPGVPNPGGTLVLHCCGNLRHYVGAKLGDTGYVRERDAEFSRRGVSRADLLRLVQQTTEEVGRTLATLADADLDGDYPEIVAGHRVAAREFVMHLAVHLGYHVGQLDYHRRVVTGDAQSAGAAQAAELPSARAVTAVSSAVPRMPRRD